MGLDGGEPLLGVTLCLAGLTPPDRALYEQVGRLYHPGLVLNQRGDLPG